MSSFPFSQRDGGRVREGEAEISRRKRTREGGREVGSDHAKREKKKKKKKA